MTVAALEPPASTVPLVLVWASALIGIMSRLFWHGAPRWLYVLIGGLAYTGGAVVSGLKLPDLVPGVSGFHEVFHLCTVISFACHWAAMLLFVLEA